ncbi:MAG: hypothetical protein ACNA8H_08390 [Anaerolineales bacterium]
MLRHISNSAHAMLLTPFVALLAYLGVLLWDKSLMAFLAVIALALLFFAVYVSAILCHGRSAENAALLG